MTTIPVWIPANITAGSKLVPLDNVQQADDISTIDGDEKWWWWVVIISVLSAITVIAIILAIIYSLPVSSKNSSQ